MLSSTDVPMIGRTRQPISELYTRGCVEAPHIVFSQCRRLSKRDGGHLIDELNDRRQLCWTVRLRFHCRPREPPSLLRRWKETYVLPSSSKRACGVENPNRTGPVQSILLGTQRSRDVLRIPDNTNSSENGRTCRIPQITSGYSGLDGRYVPFTRTHGFL